METHSSSGMSLDVAPSTVRQGPHAHGQPQTSFPNSIPSPSIPPSTSTPNTSDGVNGVVDSALQDSALQNGVIQDYHSDYFNSPFWESVRSCVVYGVMMGMALMFMFVHYALFSVPSSPHLPEVDNSIGWGPIGVYTFISIMVSHVVGEHGWRWFVDQMT